MSSSSILGVIPMFGWLKKKAAQQSLYNVEINTRTLIVVSNRADEAISKTGKPNPACTTEVAAAQKSLLTDIELALANSASFEDVQSRIEVAKSKEALTRGAEMAIEHVCNHVTITSPLRGS